MATEPHAITIHHLIVLLLTVAAVSTRAAGMDDRAAASAPTSAAADDSRLAAASAFLRASCATTLYASLCYDSLLPHASEFQTSRPRLARAAADDVAARLRSLSARVKDILRRGPEQAEGGGGGRPSETAALRDCASTISAAANLAKQSSAELAKLVTAAGGSRQARWVVGNAKTWLSAALTNEGTCADGLDEAGATALPAGKEVTAGVASVKQYTSNALALVNGVQV